MQMKTHVTSFLAIAQAIALLACGHAQPSPDEAVSRKFATRGGQNTYRPLPTLTPAKANGGGILSLDIRMRRFGGPSDKGYAVRIGNYQVADVPVFDITPGEKTAVSVMDPVTGKPEPIPATILDDPDWIFGGTLWQLTQGDRLRVKLTSELNYDTTAATQAVLRLPVNGGVPCNTTNLHTHGFLVNPTHPTAADTSQLYGDYVLDVTGQIHPASAGADDCGDPVMDHHHVVSDPMKYEIRIPGRPGESGVKSGQHPSGLFWYHPHPHGFSRMQTGGGTTGLITIGRMEDYTCKQSFVSGKCPPGSALDHPRYLELKDAQISANSVNGVHALLKEYSAMGCTAGNGECLFPADSPGIWVFTINGVQYPIISDLKPDEGEVWRIANTSANATYLLELRSDTNPAKKKQLQILALDGVSVDETSGVAMTQQILLMPGSRAEVWVSPEPGQKYILHTAATATGNNGSGDPWPDVALAEVQWPAAKATPAGAAGASIYVQKPDDFTDIGTVSLKPTAPAPVSMQNVCRFGAGDERHIYMVKSHIPPDPSGREVFGLLASIRHKNRPDDFFGGMEMVHSRADAWKMVLQNDAANPTAPAPAYGSDLGFYDICTVQGRVETWVIENWTDEDHNFHVHQTRFKLDLTREHLENHPENYYQNPKAVLTGGVGAMDTLLRNLVPKAGASSTLQTAYHDSVPVPRGEGDNCDGTPNMAGCVPGRISIHIGFKRDEQVGNFVYHCHILEHEDGGMMGEIQVCAANDQTCLTTPYPPAPHRAGLMAH